MHYFSQIFSCCLHIKYTFKRLFYEVDFLKLLSISSSYIMISMECKFLGSWGSAIDSHRISHYIILFESKSSHFPLEYILRFFFPPSPQPYALNAIFQKIENYKGNPEKSSPPSNYSVPFTFSLLPKIFNSQKEKQQVKKREIGKELYLPSSTVSDSQLLPFSDCLGLFQCIFSTSLELSHTNLNELAFK